MESCIGKLFLSVNQKVYCYTCTYLVSRDQIQVKLVYNNRDSCEIFMINVYTGSGYLKVTTEDESVIIAKVERLNMLDLWMTISSENQQFKLYVSTSKGEFSLCLDFETSLGFRNLYQISLDELSIIKVHEIFKRISENMKIVKKS
jgi:hypothetical protein